MDLKYLKRLLEIFDDSSATEISLEEDSTKIKISKRESKFTNLQSAPVATAPAQIPAPDQEITLPKTQDDISTNTLQDRNLHEITSPIVGTFYEAPSPDSSPFVKVGDKVEMGTTLCIVEAMKLMNEIESDVSGTIEKVLISNAEPVEYGQPLFLIKKN